MSPKEDFYRFAVGNWLENTTIPEKRAFVTSFTEISDQNSEKLQKILVEAAQESKNEPKGSIIQQVGDFYASGMNTERIEQLGITPIKPELAKIEALSSKEDLLILMANHSSIGIKSVFGVGVQADLKQSDTYALYAEPASLTVDNREFYLSPDYAQQREAYIGYITKMLTLAGETPSQAATQAKTILALETTLAQAKLPPAEARDLDRIYNKMTLAELESQTPHINWEMYLSELGLSDVTDIIVTEPQYLLKADEILAQRSLEDWKTYLHWQLVSKTSGFLPDAFGQEYFNFFGKVMQGVQERTPRNEEMAELARLFLGHPTAQLFVQKHFPPETKTEAEEMVKNIKAEFKRRLEQNQWMSEETRTKALEKLEKMQILVGYPDEWLDYSDVDIERDDYFGNFIRLAQWQVRRNLDKFGQPVVVEGFTSKSTIPTEINAAYNPVENRIEVPAGILQPPFFDAKLDDGVNYCSIGAVIAHEITHGFDSRGRLFDGDGNRQNWWTAEDNEKFESKAAKLVQQYSEYEALPGLFLNGELSLGENIADLGGIAIAHSALQRTLSDQERLTKLEGFTPGQRCFIAWAQIWKSKWRPEFLRQIVLTNEHPPSEFRVVGSLVNLPEFFETFDIQPNDPLWVDEADQIRIW